MTAPIQLGEIVRLARVEANSWTLSPSDALWVATEAMRRENEPASTLSSELHRDLWNRCGYYPSAREVAAIVRAALAAYTLP